MDMGDVDLLSQPRLDDLRQFASTHSLRQIVDKSVFVDSIFSWQFHNDEDYILLELVVDKFEQTFSLDAKQRRTTVQAIRDGNMRLDSLYALWEHGSSRKAPRPDSAEHSSTGLTGAYPTRGRSPSVLGWEERPEPAPATPRLRGSAQRAGPEKDRPASAPPTSRWSLQIFFLQP